MEIKKAYIQQLSFDGKSYTKGVVVDLLSAFNIACSEFPFKLLPEPKDLPIRDWAGEDGRDVYIPKNIPMKNYDIEVEFLYKGTEDKIHKDVADFINFIYGRNDGAIGGRLAIYDDYTKIGRKDVHVISIDNDVYSCDNYDPDAIATFKVKFSVEDPITNVVPQFGKLPSGGNGVVNLNFV